MTDTLGRVLVVDDEPQIHAMLSRILRQLGYDVKGATHGAQALQMVPAFEPNVVLLDLHMPVMSGLETLDHLRREFPALPVIIITGDADEKLARRTLGSGAVDYVMKPFGAAVVGRAVAAALRRPV